MNKEDIKVDGEYLLKHSSGLVRVKVVAIHKIPGYTTDMGTMIRRSAIRYVCHNLKTGRQILVKSAVKFRYLPEGD